MSLKDERLKSTSEVLRGIKVRSVLVKYNLWLTASTLGGHLAFKIKIKQESPPEAYCPRRSKYSLCCSLFQGGRGVCTLTGGTWLESGGGTYPGQGAPTLDGVTYPAQGVGWKVGTPSIWMVGTPHISWKVDIPPPSQTDRHVTFPRTSYFGRELCNDLKS